MSNKQLKVLWSISLLVIVVATLIIGGSSVFNITVPDVVKRCFGVLDLIPIPVLIYTSKKRIA